jgi:hypothetical protein
MMKIENNPQTTPPEEQPKESLVKQSITALQFEQERTNFRTLILSNPNYFGNIRVSPFKPVLNIQSNTTYEELGCVGFQPQFNRLEAIVYIKQPTGYGGDICSKGTPEYVRFFISCNNGADWQDLGLTSFTAYNISEGTVGAKRLEYAVTLRINPSQKFCFVDNLCLVRAILSWNAPPPPDHPNFTPVWGNVHNTHIQIDPLKLIFIGDLFKETKIKLPPNFDSVLDLTQPVPVAKPKTLVAMELQELYQDKGVEPHRFALTDLQKLLNQPALTESLMATGFKGVLPGIEIDWPNIIGKLSPVDGNTRYEELECIGLNPNQDTLVGIIRVKLPSGYSGSPCTAGSREYVTFWADFDNNGTFETCLGTTSVNVYDIHNFPKEGLEYAVFLPVDLNEHRQPCNKGPKVVKIRAILSWQVPPPCGNPNYVPVWGNREETLIHIKPGKKVPPGMQVPLLSAAGRVPESMIDNNGFATGTTFTGLSLADSPFGVVSYM